MRRAHNAAQAGQKELLRVEDQAQQFEFTFSYPGAGNATSPVLRLPVDTSVEFDMRSLDVIHAFFVPEFREQEDIVPGLVTHLHITPDRVGTYALECNELCGAGHTLMNTQVVVESPRTFAHWLALQKAGSKG